MADITAKMVNELRSKTGQGMMECKKALVETGGDVEKAVDYFRKKGIKSSIAERSATQGRVSGVLSADGKSGALVEVNCNTDFTAKSEPIAHLAMTAAKMLLADPSMDLSQSKEIAELLTQASQQTGENVRLGKTAVVSNPAGRVGLYLYGVTNKIGVLSSFGGTPSDELVRDVGMHVTAKIPVALSLNREGVPAEIVAREKSIAVAQAVESGKPPQIAEKIAEGKMRTFYEERVLLDQEFVNPDKFKGSVSKMLAAGGATLEKYVRIEVGQA
jgi:elongation factor Ts